MPCNLSPDQLPERCDVLVVGAGPAGSAAARSLALAGLDVVLVDQHAFPRDKVCGDALIPDAHHALERLGVLPEVMAQAQRVAHVGCVAPRGGRIDVPGTLAVLPRKQLDDILCRAAVAVGARMFAPLRLVAPLEEADGALMRVVGARLQSGANAHEIRAPWVLLATGAVPQALQAVGMCTRRAPSGIALRGYVKNDAMVGRITDLEVVWHRALRPGYGWIFPCPDGVFNIGVGVANSHKPGLLSKLRAGADDRSAMKDVNLRELFATFGKIHAPAGELLASGQWLGELKGAPLRSTLEGAVLSRAGLLVTGEAAGSTYSFTGEGIGKALETGMLAAQAVIDGRRLGWSDAAVRAHYEASLQTLRPRFDLYERANTVNAQPWLLDWLFWRARRSPRLRQRMAGVLNETSNPGNLISWKGFQRIFLSPR